MSRIFEDEIFDNYEFGNFEELSAAKVKAKLDMLEEAVDGLTLKIFKITNVSYCENKELKIKIAILHLLNEALNE